MSHDLLQILDSPRVSVPTRAAFKARLQPLSLNATYEPKILTPASMATLRCVVARLLPDATQLEIAERLEMQVATSPGDGWRYESLPADAESLFSGLRSLDEEAEGSFASLAPHEQEAILHRVQAGQVSWPGLDAVRWFEEVLAVSTAIYVSQPAVMMAMGFDGFADEPNGWSDIGLDNTQDWEPLPTSGLELER